MTGEQAAQLVDRVGRRLQSARLIRTGLLAAAISAIFGLWGLLLPGTGQGADTVVIMAAVGVWIVLSAGGANGARLISVAAGYTGSGQTELAEQALAAAADRFHLAPTPQLLAIQNLAALAHGAGAYAQAAIFSRFVVDQSGRSRKLRRAFNRPGRLLLADGELMQGNLSEAYEQLEVLYVGPQTLAEQLTLLPVACYYEVAVSWWDGLASHAPGRSRLAQLLPPAQAASTLACLALACQHTGQTGQRDWLWQQATLLIDRDELIERLPLLADLSAETAMKLPWGRGMPDSGDTE